MSAGGPLLNSQPEDDTIVQAAVGLADTPLGQRVAVTLTVLLGRDAATQVGDVIKATAEQLSSSGRLVVAQPGNGVNRLSPQGVNQLWASV